MRTITKCQTVFFDCGAAVGELIGQAEELGLSARGIDIKRYPADFAVGFTEVPPGRHVNRNSQHNRRYSGRTEKGRIVAA